MEKRKQDASWKKQRGSKNGNGVWPYQRRALLVRGDTRIALRPSIMLLLLFSFSSSRPTDQTYRSDLQVRPTGQTYRSDLQVRPTGQTYRSDLQVRPTGQTECPTLASVNRFYIILTLYSLTSVVIFREQRSKRHTFQLQYFGTASTRTRTYWSEVATDLEVRRLVFFRIED